MTLEPRGLKVDTSETLAQLRADAGRSLASSLIEIARYQTPRPHTWSQAWECLYVVEPDEPGPKRRRLLSDLGGGDGDSASSSSRPLLRRRKVRLAKERYLAVSYTWETAPGEDGAEGGYLIEPREGEAEAEGVGAPPQKSGVRDVVLDRVIAYARHVGCPNIWIDRECIDQDDRAAKEEAIQSMDLVYEHSAQTVAPLAVRVETEDQLDLLAGLLHGDFVSDGDVSQSCELRMDALGAGDAHRALELLDTLTSDQWWRRAWTFQEDYKASTHMELLISHPPGLEDSKALSGRVLGSLAGELCVNSADFRQQATRFCLAYRREVGGGDAVKRILGRAGKYKVLLREPGPEGPETSRSMSPRIFRDIGQRDIRDEEDRLAIAANCCSYSVRLDVERLKASGSSLGLAMLALFLLNGEIMHNDERQSQGSLGGNIYKFLRRQSLDNFDPPMEQQLTFIKHCRFGDVRLEMDGIRTLGHLWKVGGCISVDAVHLESGEEEETDCTGDEVSQGELEWEQLRELVRGGLGNFTCQVLANCLDSYLRKIPRRRRSGSGWYEDLMASDVLNAIQRGQRLLLAARVDPTSGDVDGSYRALFVLDEDDRWDPEAPKFYFTTDFASRHHAGDVDKHVSLEVEWRGQTPREHLPRLVVKSWANGLRFPGGAPQQDVVFAWPPALIV